MSNMPCFYKELFTKRRFSMISNVHPSETMFVSQKIKSFFVMIPITIIKEYIICIPKPKRNIFITFLFCCLFLLLCYAVMDINHIIITSKLFKAVFFQLIYKWKVVKLFDFIKLIKFYMLKMSVINKCSETTL